MGLRKPHHQEPRTLWIVAGVLFLALVFRLEYLRELYASGLWNYLRLDPLYYHDWAVRVSRGELMGTGTYEMTPLYAYSLGGVMRLFGESLTVPRILQAVAGSGCCALVALLGCRVFGRAEGIIAGLTMAVYGPAMFHDAQIMKTVLTVVLSTATAATLYVSGATRPRWLLAGGMLLGLTALCQENMNITIPFLLIWIAWRGWGLSWGALAGRAALLLAGFLAVVSPATIRNYIVSGDFVLITTGGGEVFYTGNNEQASGKYQPPSFVRPDPFFEHEDFRAEAARRLGHPVTRKESDAFWWREGLRFITSHPAAYARLMVDKVATYFNAYERPDNYSYENFRRFIPLLGLPLAGFGWVGPAGLLGLTLTARRGAELLPLQATIVAYMISGLLFFTQDRYRMPMIPLLVLFAAHAVMTLLRSARRGDLRTLGWAVPLLLGLAFFMNRDPGNSPAFEAQNHGILGEMYLVSGRNHEAETEFRTVLSMKEGADDAQAHRMIASAHYGIVLARPGAEDDETIAHLRAAGEAPDHDLVRDALTRLGVILMRRGEPAGAAAAFEKAVIADLAPSREGFWRRLKMAEALDKAGRPADSLAAVEDALRNAPPGLDSSLLADAHYGEALIYLHELRDPGRALPHLREVIRLNPSHERAEWIRGTIAALERQ